MRARPLVPAVLVAAGVILGIMNANGQLKVALAQAAEACVVHEGSTPQARPGVQRQDRRDLQGLDARLSAAGEGSERRARTCCSSCSTTSASACARRSAGRCRRRTSTSSPRTG